jgi:vanillate O-demethylase monooxygenase subunit
MDTQTRSKPVKFIRNTWYVAAEPQEVTNEKPLARTLLNEKIVLYRTAAGTAVAFKDSCPHRFAALSTGRIEGSCIRCPYHGALYDEHGQCTAVPGQDEDSTEVSPVTLVKFPTLERYNYIWIWLGDPELCGDETSIPDWFAPADPDNGQWSGRHDRFLSMPLYYELINDNLHDVSHTEFVHPETLGSSLLPRLFRMSKDKYSETMFMKKNIGERTLDLEFHNDNVQAGRMFHDMLAFHLEREQQGYPDNVDWRLTVRYATPSYFIFNPRTKVVGAPEESAIEFASLNAITPETDTSCHYFFYTANNLDSAPERKAAFTKICADGILFAFSQDEALITNQMQRVPDFGKQTESLTEVSFPGDMIPIMGRKLIRKQIAAEEAAEAAAAK